MALLKNITYTNGDTGQVNTSYHILAAVWIDYKSPDGGNVVGLVQSYLDAADREQNLHTTPYRQTIPLAGHKTDTDFFLNLENESVLQKCYEALKNTPIFDGAVDV
jgi:hypothetical protein